MANRRYTSFVERKIQDAQVKRSGQPAASAKVNVKQAFTNGQLPGKPSNWYKVKGKVVCPYASVKGAC